MMRLALDGTPLLGFRSGIGEVVAGIAPELAAPARRRARGLRAHVAGTQRPRRARARRGTRSATRPYPARLVRQAWLRSEHPGHRALDRAGRRGARHQLRRAADEGGRGGVGVRPRVPALPRVRRPPTRSTTLSCSGARSRRGAWIHTTSDFVRDEVVATFPVPAERVVRVYPGVPPVHGGDAANGHAARQRRATCSRSGPSSRARTTRRWCGRSTRWPPTTPTSGSWWPATRAGAATTSTPRSPPRATATACARPGYVSAADRADLLAGASVLAFPSHYEGFGFPPLEAMAAGIPVVATRAGAVPEVVGDAALLVDPDDADALADALRDGADRRRHPARARRRAAAHDTTAFSWDQTVDESPRPLPDGARVKAVVTGARGFVGRHLTPPPRHARRRRRVARRRRLAAGRHHRSRRRGPPHRGRVTRRRVPPRGAQPRRRVVDRRRRCSRR